MKKINIVGTSGSGKTCFSRELSKKLGYPFIEMDALFWGKAWYWPDDEEFFRKLEKRLRVSTWVLDGNYTRTIPIKWREVDTIIWIDFNFPRTLFQALKRAISRIISKEEIWPGTGNKESLKGLLSRDSIVLWTIRTYYKNRTKNLDFLNNPAYKDIEFIRLRSPKECQNYLDQLRI